MIILHINNNKYETNKSNNLLQTCLSLDIDIPYFCWHPALGSAGVCRLCAVKQYNNFQDNAGRIVMSCMTSVENNMIISTIDKEAKIFRKGIIELLMIHHPHDCPICEEGGNCHLQDMTVMNRHYKRRFIFPKRVHYNQNLGHFISHNMNRCIGCYRCVRYYKDYSGGTDFGVYGISNKIYFGRFQDGQLENECSGNLIEVCPTGVFTDKLSLDNYNRKWDLQYAPSVCQHCCIGCNIIVGEKYGKVSKIENRYHKNINQYFLCDLGRFGYTYTTSENRITQPMYVTRLKNTPLHERYAIKKITSILKKTNRVIGIGSIRSSIENNFALLKLVGKDNFCSGMSLIYHKCVRLIIDILKNSGIYTPTLREIENYDMVLIIGEDITQTSPRLALSIRQLNNNKRTTDHSDFCIPKWHSTALFNISNNKNYIYILHTHETKLDEISALNYHSTVRDQEILSSIILNKINNIHSVIHEKKSYLKKIASAITTALLSCKKPLIISGLHSGSLNLIRYAANIAKGLQNIKKHVGLVLLTSAVNSIGVGLMTDMSLNHACDIILKEKIDTVVVLENDLYRHVLRDKIHLVLKKVKNIIVFDHRFTQTAYNSNLFFPTTNFSESTGTVVNYEGRAQRFFAVFDPLTYDSKICILEGWKWLYKIYNNLNNITNYKNEFDTVVQDYTKDITFFKKIKFLAPNAKFRLFNQKIARYPHRASSRTAIFSMLNIHEPGQKKDSNTMFNFSMEGIQQPDQKSSSYIPFYWSPGWNSLHSWNKYIFQGKEYNSGIRLFKSYNFRKEYFLHNMQYNDKNNISNKKWIVVPYYLIFCNEELIHNTDYFKKKYSIGPALLNTKYQNLLNLKYNSVIKFSYLGNIFTFVVHFSKSLPLQHIGLPVGFPNIPLDLIGCGIEHIRGV
ncbi:NADH-quinone oxidoreductase subunit NuoG [Buchnera aphidicola]|uniref:NADH-quinone oxidoreductase subunit NuoG n=1 Tax=Buchnera aphidicola TaxID=9 RepID=UPI0031B867EC